MAPSAAAAAASKNKNQTGKLKNNGPKFNKASKKPFKPKKKDSNEAVVHALQLEDDVPDFPRGCLPLVLQLHL